MMLASGVLASSPSDGESIDSIIAFSKGFVCGGAGGTLRIFERSDDVREYYKCAKIFTIEGQIGRASCRERV